MAWGGKPAGNWADDVEEHESKGGQLGPAAPVGPRGTGAGDFPSLADAAKMPVPSKNAPAKKKGVKLSLTEFAAFGGAGSRPAPFNEKAILLQLPTAPRPRTEGDDGKIERGGPGLGGAFGGFGDRDRDRAGSGARGL
jgi:hypothetical protein